MTCSFLDYEYYVRRVMKQHQVPGLIARNLMA